MRNVGSEEAIGLSTGPASVNNASELETKPEHSSDAPPLLKIGCRFCGLLIDGPDRFCRYCGRRQTELDLWFYRPVWILILALLVLGPFALPLVWNAPRLGRGLKGVMAAIILIYTVLCMHLAYKLGALGFQELTNIGDIN